jgi:hypothetical protein
MIPASADCVWSFAVAGDRLDWQLTHARLIAGSPPDTQRLRRGELGIYAMQIKRRFVCSEGVRGMRCGVRVCGIVRRETESLGKTVEG